MLTRRTLREWFGAVTGLAVTQPAAAAAAAGAGPRADDPDQQGWQEPIADLDAWLEAHLDPEVHPA